MKTFLDVFICQLLVFSLITAFIQPFASYRDLERKEGTELKKQIANNETALQKLDQDCWDIQRDLYYVVIKAWAISTTNFEFSPANGSSNFSPVNNWNALFDT